MGNLLRNQRGVVLLTTYMVVLVLLALSAAFFSRTIQEKNMVQRQDDSLQAFYNAETGISYAYFESANADWEWFTHSDSGTSLFPDALRTEGSTADCEFITAGEDTGCYAAQDGSFILKAFRDPELGPTVTVVRVKGIGENIERILEYRIKTNTIFDFAWWTPYSLNISDVGENINGGRIHANENIYIDCDQKRLRGIDTLSTGENGTIRYSQYTQYYAPYCYDFLDGIMDGKAPLPDLELDADNKRRWRGTLDSHPDAVKYPWNYESGLSKKGAADNLSDYWPPFDWRNVDSFFYGSSLNKYNVDAEEGEVLNYFNTWVYPAEKDADGNIEFDRDGEVILEAPKELPGELSQEWQTALWDKYSGYDYGGRETFELYGEEGAFAELERENDPLEFVVYDPDSLEHQAPDEDYWNKLKAMTFDTLITNPLDGTEELVTVSFAEILEANVGVGWTYDRLSGENVQPQNTLTGDYILNSMQQPAAWENFLDTAGLTGRVMDGNTGGQTIEAPRFATTYKEKSIEEGLYLSKSAGDYTLHYGGKARDVNYTVSADDACGAYSDYDNSQEYWNCIEARIDALVKRLNTDRRDRRIKKGIPVRKVKFINTYTNETNTVLEIDVDKMKRVGTFPDNGIIYSEVPVRLTNAEKLPFRGRGTKATFNVICEENVYLKGNYNNPRRDRDWTTSAIISKKQIYTLSDNFNDPGWSGYDDGFSDTLSDTPSAVPALAHYPNYPYVYVKTEEGNFVEADPAGGEGTWEHYENYPVGSSQYKQAYELMNEVNTVWRNTFVKEDSEGTNVYTVSDHNHPMVNGETWGAMPNQVEDNTTYNCLLASYWNGDNSGIPAGVELEEWWYDDNGDGEFQDDEQREKTMNGAYFQLEEGSADAEENQNRFAALADEGLDFRGDLPYDNRGCIYTPEWLYTGAETTQSYDQRFRSLAENKPILFGGGEDSWREISESVFNQTPLPEQ
jgi:hypothetical protein